MNVYARANDQRLSDVVDRVANQVGFGAFGAHMVHLQPANVTKESPKLLPSLGLIKNVGDWRRGESNPRPVMLQNKRLHV